MPTTNLDLVAAQAGDWLTEPLTEVGQTYSMAGNQSSWLTNLATPWANAANGLWSGVTGTAVQVNQALPNLMTNWLGQQIGLIPKPQDQGGGTTVINYQPPTSGGLPAQAQYIPGQTTGVPMVIPQSAGFDIGTIITIGIVLVVVVLIVKK